MHSQVGLLVWCDVIRRAFIFILSFLLFFVCLPFFSYGNSYESQYPWVYV